MGTTLSSMHTGDFYIIPIYLNYGRRKVKARSGVRHWVLGFGQKRTEIRSPKPEARYLR
jgi:hypothetical protein